ncbi:MAG: KpsF/GutQ family sugar-phosphate isomerase [Planctomycetaceae bacterium]
MPDHANISAAQKAGQVILSFNQADHLREARRIIQHEAAVLQSVAESLSIDFCEAISLMQDCSGTVITTGVGKAGLIGQKIVATLASTGTRARFLHPTEALHGDLGTVDIHDVVLAFSNSGETDELTRLLPCFAHMKVPVIAVTRDRENSLARAASVTIAYGHHVEAGHLALAPSSSTTAMLAIGDAIALVLSQARGFSSTDFARFHPAGSLGRKLTPVDSVMRTGTQVRVARDSETVREVMIGHSQSGRRTGAVILVNQDGRLSGLFTDSDLARLFEHRRDEQLDQSIREVMTANPVTISRHAVLPAAIHLMSERKLSELPVIDEEKRPVGMLDITDVLHFMDSTQQQQLLSELNPAAVAA